MAIVARKSFVFMTLLIPLLSLLGIGAPFLLSKLNGGDQRKVVIVDEGSNLGSLIVDNEDYDFQLADQMTKKDPRKSFDKADGDIYAIVILPANLQKNNKLSVFSDKPVNSSLVKYLETTLNSEITRRNISTLGVPDIQKKIDECNAKVDVAQIQWNDEGQDTSGSAEVSQILGIMLALLAYMFVIMYGAMIMNGVIEEKTNRIVEVVVSSCKPSELMLGKIIGVGLAGLTQLLIWGILTIGIAFAFGLGSVIVGASGATEAINAMSAAQGSEVSPVMTEMIKAIAGINIAQLLIAFVFYGIGGFMLFGSLFAAFGSAVDQPNDASQFTMPIIMIEVFALWAGMACIDNPDGPLAMWCSMIPFTSPIVMMVRLPYEVPFWQLALSLVILYASAFALVALASRIYRRGILMYGKKASIMDIFRWIK